MRRIAKKARVFWPLLFVVLLADCTTKRIAVERLAPPGTPHEVVGHTVRITLACNDRASMGLPVGPGGKESLGLLGLLAAAGLFARYRRASAENVLLAAAASLYIAGALGNAWGRVFSSRGVVDFIDVGLGTHRFWTFNLADMSLFAAIGLLAVWRARDGGRPGGGTRSARRCGGP